MVLAVCVGRPGLAQIPRSPAVIWHDRGDARALDLVGGPGGKAHEPGNSKSVSKDYADTKFIAKVTATHVDFVMQSRPLFPFVVLLPSYRERTRMQDIVKRIPIADARWLGDRLGRLSLEQIRDCFRASGFAPDEVETYAQAVMQRIGALTRLNGQGPSQLRGV